MPETLHLQRFVGTIEGFALDFRECNTILPVEEVKDGIVLGRLQGFCKAVGFFLEVYLWIS